MNRFTTLTAAALLLTTHFSFGAKDIVAAIKSDDVSTVIFILNNAGSEEARRSDANGVTPLHIAAAMDKPDMIDLLASFGGDVNARTLNGFTPLHWAASRNATSSIRALIQVGAETDITTDTGITPLHWAASKNATNAVTYLLSHEGNIDSRTVSGLKPLHWAVAKDADDAAHILAYVEVERDTETETIEVLPFEPEANEELDPSSVTVPRPIMTPTIHKGHSFEVQLGAGEELSFIWLEAIKLWVGKFEVTNGEYRRFKHTHTSMFAESITLDSDDQPVVFVTWNEAKEYCNWLNRNYSDTIPDNWIFRLPTAGEWVFSAKCGTDRKYPWGDEWPPLYGNYSDISAKKTFPNWQGIPNYHDSFPATCPVIHSGTNDWGICGMGGNVWEWCEDWYGKERKSKVRHGGGWDFDAKSSLAIDYQGFDKPNMKFDTVGFRVVIAKRQSIK
jgi:formylglycine-generating enzyme required for sulfatase activity